MKVMAQWKFSGFVAQKCIASQGWCTFDTLGRRYILAWLHRIADIPDESLVFVIETDNCQILQPCTFDNGE